MRVRSESAKKDAWAWVGGPPTLPPYWFCLLSGLAALARFEKKSIESIAWFRKYSYAVPCTLLVPDFVETLTAAPGDRPYSAAYGLVTTLNSWIASTDGRETCVVSSWTFSEMLLLSTPSIRKVLCSGRGGGSLLPTVR